MRTANLCQRKRVSSPVVAILGLCLAVTILASASGCSVFSRSTGTPEAKATALVFTNEYLTSILNGPYEKTHSLVIWSRYQVEKPGVTPETVEKQYTRTKRQLKLENHPLYNLTLIDIWMRGDDAEVTLQRLDGPYRPEVKVNLLWAVNGWGVISDNIFGEDGLIEEAIARNSAPR